MKLGERIKFIRGRLTLAEFGEKLSENSIGAKFDRSNLSRYEKGIVRPGTDFYIALGEVFDIDLNWVLRGKGHQYKPVPIDYEAEAKKIDKLFKNQDKKKAE